MVLPCDWQTYCVEDSVVNGITDGITDGVVDSVIVYPKCDIWQGHGVGCRPPSGGKAGNRWLGAQGCGDRWAYSIAGATFGKDMAWGAGHRPAEGWLWWLGAQGGGDR